MKIIFAGTPPFAAAALAALHAAHHQVTLVLTQPDRPAGRGMKLRISAVAEQAMRLGLAVAKPESLKDAAIQALLRELAPDAMVVAAYGLILPQAVLDIPRHGCINIHASLLPRWRGAAPIQRAIEAGDTETGIAIMQMNAGLDTGPVLLTRPVAIAASDTGGSLLEKLTNTAGAAIVDALEKLTGLPAIAQPVEGATYANKVAKSEAQIEWKLPAAAIERRIRAFDPVPGCESKLAGESIKIWQSALAPAPTDALTAPGTIVAIAADRLAVQCGDGVLDLLTVQKSGGKRLSIAQFLRGAKIQTGWHFA